MLMHDGSQMPMLHIYAQDGHHNEAHVFGNVAGLQQLRDAIDAALKAHPEDEAQTFYPSDGEGYGVEVRLGSDAWMWMLPTQYTDFPYKWREDENRAWSALMDGRARPDRNVAP